MWRQLTAYVLMMRLLAKNQGQWFTIEAIMEGVVDLCGLGCPREEYEEEALTGAIDCGEIEVNRDTGNPIYAITARGCKTVDV